MNRRTRNPSRAGNNELMEQNNNSKAYWNTWYMVVIGVLVLLVAFFAWITNYFS